MEKFGKFIFVALALIGVMSCSTVKYYGPQDFVEFKSSENLKSSEQITIDPQTSAPVTTYDHEFTYDTEGFLVKSKETEYFDRSSENPKFVVWETEWKVLDGKPVPYRVSVNGEVFCTTEYEILNVEADGRIFKDIYSAYYYKVVSRPLSASFSQYWDISLNKYPVPYKADKKFVRQIEVFNIYYGYSNKNILNIGFDNIVLKKYNYSYEKLLAGFSKSFPYGSRQSSRMKSLAVGSNVDFSYEWEAIADKACPTKIEFIARDDNNVFSNLEINMEYNAGGDRTSEEWVVIDDKDDIKNRITVFTQKLNY